MSNKQYSLRNTELVIIRPLEPEDIPSIDAMHDRLSKDSLYYRYFTAYKPSLSVLVEQTRLSRSRGVAFVAVLKNSPQEVVGLAYYVCSLDDVHIAEPALLIEDRYQGEGLGWAMLECLVCEAQTNGVTCFQSYVLPANLRVLRLLEKTGLPMQRHYCDGIVEVKLDLGYEPCISTLSLTDLSATGSDLESAILAVVEMGSV